jgi:NADPH-dependent 2,4-dienoyl-CoA reductase/sulfur reductase-like enzyme
MTDPQFRSSACRVAIVGGGPAGLGAALELRRRGIDRVVVIEREAEAGGIPRHCGHPVFGWREFGRVLSGPAYARRLRDAALAAGVEIRTRSSVIQLYTDGKIELASPAGLERLTAERVVLATGLREAPRSARLVGGDRPWGVLTTGALQSFVYLERMRPFRRPVIVGTELVSFSAILTAREAGMRPVAMIEEHGHITARWPSAWMARAFGLPLRLGTRLVDVRGNGRVEAVTVETGGKTETIDCDGVIFTGRFLPAAELVRSSPLRWDSGSGGPVIDQFGRCSDPAYFAAGNLLRAVETSGWCYREGRRIGGFVAEDVQGRLPRSPRRIEFECGPAIKLIVPQSIEVGMTDPSAMLQLRVDRPVAGRLTIDGGGQRLWQRRLKTRPERRILIPLQELSIPPGVDRLHVGVTE